MVQRSCLEQLLSHKCARLTAATRSRSLRAVATSELARDSLFFRVPSFFGMPPRKKHTEPVRASARLVAMASADDAQLANSSDTSQLPAPESNKLPDLLVEEQDSSKNKNSIGRKKKQVRIASSEDNIMGAPLENPGPKVHAPKKRTVGRPKGSTKAALAKAVIPHSPPAEDAMQIDQTVPEEALAENYGGKLIVMFLLI